MPRPKPQPATPTIPKIKEPHPAAQPPSEPYPTIKQPATQGSTPDDTLVPFSTRLPVGLRNELEYLRYLTGRPIQQHVIAALKEYIEAARARADLPKQ